MRNANPSHASMSEYFLDVREEQTSDHDLFIGMEAAALPVIKTGYSIQFFYTSVLHAEALSREYRATERHYKIKDFRSDVAARMKANTRRSRWHHLDRDDILFRMRTRLDWISSIKEAKRANDVPELIRIIKARGYGKPIAWERLISPSFKALLLKVRTDFNLSRFVRPTWHGNRIISENHPELAALHFVHKSTEDPKMIAYAPTTRHLEEGRWVKTKPGKYLTKFYSDVLTEKEIKAMAERQSGDNSSLKLTVFRNGDNKHTNSTTWIRLYSDIQVDYSCMQGCDCVSVYGYPNNGLGLAYYTHSSGSLMCRAIVRFDRNPEGEFTRCYPMTGDDGWPAVSEEEFAQALIASGMTKSPDGLEGIKIIKEEESSYDSTYVMPYIDRPAQYVNDRGTYFLITRCGDIEAASTSGSVRLEPENPCYDCGCHIGEDDGTYIEYHGTICQRCLDRNYTYAHIGRRTQEYVPSDSVVYCESDNEYYHEDYASEVLRQTEDGDWYDAEDVAETPTGMYHVDDCTSLDHEFNDCSYARDGDAVQINGEMWYKHDPDLPSEDEDDAADAANDELITEEVAA